MIGIVGNVGDESVIGVTVNGRQQVVQNAFIVRVGDLENDTAVHGQLIETQAAIPQCLTVDVNRLLPFYTRHQCFKMFLYIVANAANGSYSRDKNIHY